MLHPGYSTFFPFSKYQKKSRLGYGGKRIPLLLLILVCLLAGTGCSFLDPKPEPPKPVNPTGATGRYNAEAEQLFGKARVLWGKEDVCSKPELAVEYLDQALALEPDYAEALVRRGLALSELGYQEDAFDDFTKAIRLAPTGDAYAGRGLAAFRSGNTAGARNDLDEAIRLNPRLTRAWNLRGAIAYDQGNLEEACKNFEQACSAGDCTGLEAAKRDGACR